MSFQSSIPALGSILVIGGYGFFGFHLVRKLLELPGCDPIYVISRNPFSDCVDGVEYWPVDITHQMDLLRFLQETKPQVIFHVAASRAIDSLITPQAHYKNIFHGTKNIVDAAKHIPEIRYPWTPPEEFISMVFIDIPQIKALTCAVAAGYQHFNIDETTSTWEQNSSAIPYIKAKVAADYFVQESNVLFTCSLRLPMVYGERDTQYITSQLDALKNGKTNIQLGDEMNMVQPVYTGNAAIAHILAAQGLLSSIKSPRNPDDRIDGEAFHIHNGEPEPFWDFTRRTWRHAGHKAKMENVTVIPAWLALGIVTLIEALFKIFTLEQIRPPLAISRLFIQVTI